MFTFSLCYESHECSCSQNYSEHNLNYLFDTDEVDSWCHCGQGRAVEIIWKFKYLHLITLNFPCRFFTKIKYSWWKSLDVFPMPKFRARIYKVSVISVPCSYKNYLIKTVTFFYICCNAAPISRYPFNVRQCKRMIITIWRTSCSSIFIFCKDGSRANFRLVTKISLYPLLPSVEKNISEFVRHEWCNTFLYTAEIVLKF